MPYRPEQDGGRKAPTTAFISADVWIPKGLVRNPVGLLRTSEIEGRVGRDNEKVVVQLVREEKHHFVAPRHLYSSWEGRLGGDVEIIVPTAAKFDFNDNISPRSASQESAWEAFAKEDKGILNLACGKGKTVLTLKKIAQHGEATLVLVNSLGLLSQWSERAQEFLGLSPDNIGFVQGKAAEWDRPLVIASLQTLASRIDSVPWEVRERFGMAVYDEAHHMSAQVFSRAANFCLGRRYGLSATAEREDGLEGVYYAQLGDIFYTDLRGDLEAKIFIKKLNTRIDKSAYLDKAGQTSAGLLAIEMANLRSRNRQILSDTMTAARTGRKVLVLGHAAHHPTKLGELFKELGYDSEFEFGIVDRSVPGEERGAIISKYPISFATVGVAKEGLDVPALDTVIFATPLRAWGLFQQCKGRAERKCAGKKHPVVILYDDYLVQTASGQTRGLRRRISDHGLKYAYTSR